MSPSLMRMPSRFISLILAAYPAMLRPLRESSLLTSFGSKPSGPEAYNNRLIDSFEVSFSGGTMMAGPSTVDSTMPISSSLCSGARARSRIDWSITFIHSGKDRSSFRSSSSSSASNSIRPKGLSMTILYFIVNSLRNFNV